MSRNTPGKGPKRLRTYLPGGLARAVSRHADEAGRLKNAWHSNIPDPLASRTHPVRYDAGVLFVHADTPAWLSRLRQQQAGLMTLLRRDPTLRDLTEIRMRVVPRDVASRQAVTKRAPSRLSATAAAQIERSADGIADAGLRDALKRLAQQVDGTPGKRRR